MKRLHIHISVENLEQGIRFYSTLFAHAPDKQKEDYARWRLDDPAVNFAISARSQRPGIDHLGIQVDDETELDHLRDRLHAGHVDTFGDGASVCCYAESDKSWIEDPVGVPWEVYRNMQDAAVFHELKPTGESACCTPTSNNNPCCG